jgi:hypothetical protein
MDAADDAMLRKFQIPPRACTLATKPVNLSLKRI